VFSGPAFLAWSRMGNIQGFGGPLISSWLDGQYNLQLKILTRMREFQMIPVLSAFNGFVPSAIQQLYPNATITKTNSWNGFNGNQ
jgi:alpha-N-acetylglucosaminidase